MVIYWLGHRVPIKSSQLTQFISIILNYLGEFIEDCEHSDLACEVLRVIGREGPKASNPRTYIQYVYNRVLLESPQVRAAAISVLGAFGSECPALLPSVVVLLERCLLDDDNLVRDRASMLLAMLSGENGTNLISDGLQVCYDLSRLGLIVLCSNFVFFLGLSNCR